ncbi:AI-2E family transporter [Actinoplanes sp. CA-142083]|uniref:AI-2E family transporter n=1 Tax=Actinoplanes sp. CA-142083 TaxID=3239903 RepID=UPI003D8BFA08
MIVSLFTVGLWPRTIIVVIFFALYQLAENYLLVPRVFRNTVDMPAAAVLLVALTGGTLLGLAGVIMAIPIAATIKVVLSPPPAKEPAARDGTRASTGATPATDLDSGRGKEPNASRGE